MYSSGVIAREFLDRAERDDRYLTVMQVLKLVYMTHGFNLAITDKPLIVDRVEAWKFGPVIPPLYGHLKRFGSGPIPRSVETGLDQDYLVPAHLSTVHDPNYSFRNDLFEKIWEKYGFLTGLQLSYLTHEEGTPWFQSWHDEHGAGVRGKVISDSVIKKHYKEILNSGAAEADVGVTR